LVLLDGRGGGARRWGAEAGRRARRTDPATDFEGTDLERANFEGTDVKATAPYFGGGRSTVNGVENSDLQSNSRFGVTIAVPLGRAHSLQVAAHSGAFTRVGADFQVGTIGYRYRWFDSRKAK
jgi:hypothetical protein